MQGIDPGCRRSRARMPPKRGSLQAGTDGRSLILSTLDGGARDRNAEEFEAFLVAARELVTRLDAS